MTAAVTVQIDDELVGRLAAVVADQVAGRLADSAHDGYLDAEAAGRYLCVPRKRIHDLTSAGALVPDGRDGRKPLYRRATLDAYAQASR